MSKFNSQKTMRTTNHEGNAAYAMPDRLKLVTQVLTSFFNEKKFYGDNSDEIKETIKRVIKDDPQFVSNLAVFARREFNMRSIAHVLTSYLAHEPEGKPYVRSTVKGISLRGDDVTELMSFYLKEFGKPIPNSLKKGIGDAMKTFDEYTLAKYKGSGKSVKMRDLLCLCRPKPIDYYQEQLWKRCLEDNLATPITWETQLSANGNNKETWEKLIAENSVGYMALLRNLRNIMKAEPSNIDKVFAKIADPVAVRKSKQLPFRFLSAYSAIRDLPWNGKAIAALEKAVNESIANLPKIPGRTVIAIDESGSMAQPISGNSEVSAESIAILLGIIASRICEEAIVYTFDDNIRKLYVDPHGEILNQASNFEADGCWTDVGIVFREMTREKIIADRVIILSDNECNDRRYRNNPVQFAADAYRCAMHSNIWVHAIDLRGYGTQQFSGSKTNILAGWSEKVFDFILLAEQGAGSLEKKIREYTW